jgi:hypothetical protein
MPGARHRDKTETKVENKCDAILHSANRSVP